MMTRVALILAVLHLAGCASSNASRARVPRRLVVKAGEGLPADLRGESTPEVIVLLLLSGSTEDAIAELRGQMSERGFWAQNRRGHDCLGVAELRFFGGVAEVLWTTSVETCRVASEVLFDAGIPFGWGSSQGEYLFVPAARASAARDFLRADHRIKGRVIDDDA